MGFDSSCFLKLEIVDERVKAIRFECLTRDAQRRAALRAGLVALDADRTGAICDTAFLEAYFREMAAASE